MALNRRAGKVSITAAANTWVQVPLATTGKKFSVFIQNNKKVATPAVVEIALSVAAPAGAGTVLPLGEASECIIMNAATHTLWVRRTTVTSIPTLEVQPSVNGNVLSATA